MSYGRFASWEEYIRWYYEAMPVLAEYIIKRRNEGWS